jgi:transcriptional regulator with XRE-family HTH domain
MKGNKLKAEIIRNGMTIQDFIKKLYMSKTTFWRRLANIESFNAGEIKRIAKILNLDLMQILAIFYED